MFFVIIFSISVLSRFEILSSPTMSSNNRCRSFRLFSFSFHQIWNVNQMNVTCGSVCVCYKQGARQILTLFELNNEELIFILLYFICQHRDWKIIPSEKIDCLKTHIQFFFLLKFKTIWSYKHIPNVSTLLWKNISLLHLSNLYFFYQHIEL